MQIFWNEQIPQKLGKTADNIEAALKEAKSVEKFEKSCFSCYGDDNKPAAYSKFDNFILVGMSVIPPRLESFYLTLSARN